VNRNELRIGRYEGAVSIALNDKQEQPMKKILIVDDDADLRDAIKMVLAEKYEIKEAGNKADAQNELKGFMPDLVILDVMMDTNSTGFELSREIKTSLPATKVLMLTGVDQAMNIDFKSEAGNPDWLPCDDYLSKPVVPKTLLEKVTSLVP
jgi:two-component system, OmpR family, response regulator